VRKNEYKSAKMSARKAESKKRGFNPESGERQRVRKNEHKVQK
jgi:hypothetical protein